MTYYIPSGYTPHQAPYPPNYPPPPPCPNCSSSQRQDTAPPVSQPSLLSLLLLGGVLGLMVLLILPSGESRGDLKAKNAQLRQEILWLQNRNAQLEHQLIGVYSSP